MAALTVWVLDVEHIDASIATVTRLKANGWVDVLDAAVVQWPAGAARPSTTHIDALAGDRPLPASFWNALFGLTFFAHEMGVGLASAGATLERNAADLGVEPALARQVREHVRPGIAAIFVYSVGSFAETGANAEEIRSALGDYPVHLLRSNLSAEQERRVRSVIDR